MLQRRPIRQIGARLALFAVWLQVVLTLGHIHPSDIYRFGHPVVHGHGVEQVVAPQPGSAPAGRNETGAPDQACAICANMALAASLVLPDPVYVTPGSSTVRVSAAMPATLLIAATPHRLFQTRAPPSA